MFYKKATIVLSPEACSFYFLRNEWREGIVHSPVYCIELSLFPTQTGAFFFNFTSLLIMTVHLRSDKLNLVFRNDLFHSHSFSLIHIKLTCICTLKCVGPLKWPFKMFFHISFICLARVMKRQYPWVRVLVLTPVSCSPRTTSGF